MAPALTRGIMITGHHYKRRRWISCNPYVRLILCNDDINVLKYSECHFFETSRSAFVVSFLVPVRLSCTLSSLCRPYSNPELLHGFLEVTFALLFAFVVCSRLHNAMDVQCCVSWPHIALLCPSPCVAMFCYPRNSTSPLNNAMCVQRCVT